VTCACGHDRIKEAVVDTGGGSLLIFGHLVPTYAAAVTCVV
jgi:hypothetical protein